MATPRQHTTPLIVSGLGEAVTVTHLERVQLDASGKAADRPDEAWLQRLIHARPELLPVREIEPAFLPAIPVCTELPTPSGYIDNFLVTPTGNLLFAECKLWRNPEARRQVVAQVMDYVQSVTTWGYADLEAAVRRGTFPSGGRPPERLYDLVSADGELDESDFIDAVSRNLRRGRGLFFVVGDGIREEAESLFRHLQAHAGIHFALTLVELALYRLPGGDTLLVQPRVIARTVNIERGVVRIEDPRIALEPAKPESQIERRGLAPLSEEEFYTHLAVRDPALPDRLRALLTRLEEVGIEPEFRRSLILRWHAVDGTTLNVGYIKTNGETWTDLVNWQARATRILDLTQSYVRELAGTLGGDVKTGSDKDNIYVVLQNKLPRIEELLAHEDAWVQAIRRLADRVNNRLATTNASSP